jgi:hypothetical protein
VFLDVFYALVAFRMLAYLPPVQDASWMGKPLGLLGPIVHNPRELWRMVMGLGLTVICWMLSMRRLNRLRRTDGIHMWINLIQTGLVCFFIYFAVCDPMLSGGPSSRALQCGSLALAGVAGELGWAYARRRGLVDAAVPTAQLDAIGRDSRTETATALLNAPLAWVGPVSWTLGWFLFPFLIARFLPWLGRARQAARQTGAARDREA